jgi:hypothetical protein
VGRTGTTRRRALMTAGAVTAGLLTACSPEPPGPGPEEARKAKAAALEETTLRIHAAAVSRSLLAHYDAVLAAHPGQHTRLAPLRTAVGRHIAALAPSSEGAVRSPAPPAAPAVPADPVQAVTALATAERGTADAHTTALMKAPPELARLLASVAAASAAHAYLLTEGPRP